MRTRFLVLGLLLTPALAFAGENLKCDRNVPIEKKVSVERTVDGDTLHIRTKAGVYSVRMIGMDTPETHYFGHDQGKWGQVAADRLAEILPEGTPVTLEFAPDQCDTYGRVLAHVFKGKLHVNRQMVKEGLAVIYCMYPSVAYCDDISKDSAAAIKQRLGMFTDSNVELPYDFRHRISKRGETSFVGSLKTKVVYRPGNEERTPIAERIFFSNEASVKSPFHVED